VEDGAMQATEAGDHERALFLRMQVWIRSLFF
jgi:hypothetical protein